MSTKEEPDPLAFDLDGGDEDNAPFFAAACEDDPPRGNRQDGPLRGKYKHAAANQAPDWMPDAPEHLLIRHDTITTEYGQIAQRISEQGRVYGLAVYRAYGAEARRKAKEAELLLKVRAHLNLNAPKDEKGKTVKPTEPQIEATMRGADPWRSQWVQAYDEEAGLMAAKEAAKADLQALIASAQLLKEGAQDRRAEMYNIDPRLMNDPAQRAAGVNSNPVTTYEPKTRK